VLEVVREFRVADLFSEALNLGLIGFVKVKSLGELDENDPWSDRSDRRANLFSQLLNDLIAQLHVLGMRRYELFVCLPVFLQLFAEFCLPSDGFVLLLL
jgi:hypothetical protein